MAEKRLEQKLADHPAGPPRSMPDRREMDADEARTCAEVRRPRLPVPAPAEVAGVVTAGPVSAGAATVAQAQSAPAQASHPPPIDIFNFDLHGYLLLKGALSPKEVNDLNETLDAIPPLQPQEWHGRVHRQDYVADAETPPWGINLQNIAEAGPAFENLIDHPSWLGHCRYFVGQDDLYIDEHFVTIRNAPGTGSPLHSGAHKRAQRTQFRYHDGQFHCGEINILIALDDVGPDDGATTVSPLVPLATALHACPGSLLAHLLPAATISRCFLGRINRTSFTRRWRPVAARLSTIRLIRAPPTRSTLLSRYTRRLETFCSLCVLTCPCEFLSKTALQAPTAQAGLLYYRSLHVCTDAAAWWVYIWAGRLLCARLSATEDLKRPTALRALSLWPELGELAIRVPTQCGVVEAADARAPQDHVCMCGVYSPYVRRV